jgi:hypothetical protein
MSTLAEVALSITIDGEPSLRQTTTTILERVVTAVRLSNSIVVLRINYVGVKVEKSYEFVYE